MKKNCSFCCEIKNQKKNNMFLKWFADYIKKGLKNRIIHETKDYCILPTIGPLIEGHLLILPKKHYLSYAQIDTYESFNKIKKITKKILFKAYNQSPIFFEHGEISQKLKAGSTYDHAHLHVIPIRKKIDIGKEFLKYGFNLRQISHIQDLSIQKEKKIPYLFFENKEGGKFVCDAFNVESQFIRKLIARKINKRESMTWQQDLKIDMIVKTIKKLRPLFGDLNGK